MSTTVIGYLVNPYERTITKAEYSTDNGNDPILDLLLADDFQRYVLLDADGDGVYLARDDERPTLHQAAFALFAHYPYPFPGMALIVGPAETGMDEAGEFYERRPGPPQRTLTHYQQAVEFGTIAEFAGRS